MDMVRPTPDSPPVKSLPGMGDHPTAISLYAGIATALFRRERTGRGSYVATNLMANGLWWNALHAQAMLCGVEFPRRPGREDAPSALHNFYRTSDGRWLQLVVHPGGQALAAARASGRPAGPHRGPAVRGSGRPACEPPRPHSGARQGLRIG